MLNKSLNLEQLRLELGSEWPIVSDGWSVLGLKEGKATFVGQGKPCAVDTGDVIIISPTRHGRLRGQGASEVKATYFHFYPGELMGILSVGERLLFDRAKQHRDIIHVLPATCALARRYRSVIAEIAPAATLEHRCQLLQLLDSVLCEIREEIQKTTGQLQPMAARITELLSEVGDSDLQNFTVEELAAKCRCSRRHLTRFVREHFGCSVITLKMQFRLERAASLLYDPDVKVVDVALDCGFNHLGLFTAKFKQRYGTTPAKWRERVLCAEKAGPLEPRAFA